MPDQLLRSLVSGARMPLAASVGVSVLPSSVMSGMFLPLDSAVFQSVVRLPHGIQSTLTWVLAYCGKSWWNCATMPFIQVTWAGTEPPIRQTVSVDGADDVLLLEVLLLVALLLGRASARCAAGTAGAAAGDGQRRRGDARGRAERGRSLPESHCWHSFCEGELSVKLVT